MPFPDIYRAQMLSAPNCSFLTGDAVLCRLTPTHHEFAARVVGRTFERRPRYDVTDNDGDLHKNVTIIRLDEPALAGAK